MIRAFIIAALFPWSLAVFFEGFDRQHLEHTWRYPSNAKYTKFTASNVYVARRKQESNVELRVPKKNAHYGIAAMLDVPFVPQKGIVIQFDTTSTEGHTCGGRYLKLLSSLEGFSPEDLSNTTPFSILFGPDKCEPVGQIRLIISHRDPVSGQPVEKHWSPRIAMKDDTLPHVYTLVIRTDNQVEIMEDGDIVASGSLFDHLVPPINPPSLIPDPEDIKPPDWVDEEYVLDPNARQPDDWVTASVIVDKRATKPPGWLDDKARLVPKKGAKKPRGWDEEEDGEWAPPMIPNLKCDKVGCGRWMRPMVPNPAFKGQWRPPMIQNPSFKGHWVQRFKSNPDANLVDPHPLANVANISAVAIEIWTTDEGYQWDNIYVGRSVKDAKTLRDEKWLRKYLKQKEAIDRKNAEAEKIRAKDKEDLARARRRNLMGNGLQGFPLYLLNIYDSLPGSIRTILAPTAEAVRRTPNTAYLLLALPLGLPLFIIIINSVAKVPREITDPEDDSEDEEEKENEQENVTNASKTRAKGNNSGIREKGYVICLHPLCNFKCEMRQPLPPLRYLLSIRPGTQLPWHSRRPLKHRPPIPCCTQQHQ